MTPVQPFMLDQTGADNPAGLGPADVRKLLAGGPTGKLRFLYPYDGTVFPDGMLAPALMWEGDATAGAVYVRIKSQAFEYKTVINSTAVAPRTLSATMPQLRIPQEIWRTAGQHALGKTDVFTVELSTHVDGVVAGPIITHFTIARAAVRGSIYYDSYGSNLDQFLTAGVGDMLRLPFGGKAERVLSAGDALSGRCYGCHAVAANGSTLVVQSIDRGAPAGMQTQGWSYPLDPTGIRKDAPNTVTPNAGFVALYPDGSKYLASSQAVSLGISNIYEFPDRLASPRSLDAALYDVATAQVIPDTGIPPGALMPMFSPDGTRLAFTDYARNAARSLAIMDYDVHRDRAANYRLLAQEPPGPEELASPGGPLMTDGTRPGWPFFLPDNQAIVFVRTASKMFSSGLLGAVAQNTADPNNNHLQPGGLTTPDASDLYIVDVVSGRVTPLAQAMGFRSPDDFVAGTSYLPFGMEDEHQNYFPTVNPVASGGYFWVFFDSLRHYGNLGLQRQLWGAAIDIQPDGRGYLADPSHPAFYLEGQELGPDNHRAFSALDLCRPEGTPCAIGIDCCTGFCSETCVPPTQDTCAKRDEHCTASSECCNSADSCINGFCALVELL